MDRLTKKTLTTKRGFTYTYYMFPAASGKPTLLLLHGFPDTAEEWADLTTQHLVPAGYGVIAPDLLGYGGTSKPTDPAAYKFGGMTADLVEILDAEETDKVVSLGHDWGSRAAQMLYNLHPGRVSGLVMVDVAYAAPQRGPIDLDAILAASEKALGYGPVWYWKLFTADDGAGLMTENADVLFDMLHAPGAWMATFCAKDGVRRALETRGEGLDIKRRPYATEEMKNAFVGRVKRDGFDAPVCWYKSHVFGCQSEEPNPENAVVNVPTLFLGYPEDVIGRKENILPSVQAGLLPQLTNVTLNGAHWGLLENPKEFGEAVTQWLDEAYGSSKL
ncbi:Bifunctional epoxide hydrolase 2 [Cytospora mali]|uniref:Bifunctional epoxide hydrolase 2 n=1 Tax=Cytospora mali TaxID=578113 RepID=A0A194W423_CYTMA|nr:Bifunctional epoxide hydrolase 2 [Valsa mali]